MVHALGHAFELELEGAVLADDEAAIWDAADAELLVALDLGLRELDVAVLSQEGFEGVQRLGVALGVDVEDVVVLVGPSLSFSSRALAAVASRGAWAVARQAGTWSSVRNELDQLADGRELDRAADGDGGHLAAGGRAGQRAGDRAC